MRRTNLAILIAGLGLVVIVGCVGLSKKSIDTGSNNRLVETRQASMTKSATASSQSAAPGEVHSSEPNGGDQAVKRGLSSRRRELVSGRFVKEKSLSVIYSLPRRATPLAQLEVLDGVHGSIKPLSHLRAVDVVNGIHFYESTSEASPLNVVYHRKTDAIGVWSGELIVTGERESLEKLASDFNFIIVHLHEGRMIARAPSGFSLMDDLEALVAAASPAAVELDIRYGSLQRQ